MRIPSVLGVPYRRCSDSRSRATSRSATSCIGVSVRVKPDVRVGAEVFGVRSFDSSVESWAAVGPNFAWTRGRVWFASSFGIGLHNISSAGRLVWGIGF